MSENNRIRGGKTLPDWGKVIFSQTTINKVKHFPLAVLANIYYRFPSKKLIMIGVTGTDGKTTTVNLIYNLLLSAGFKAGMVSTVSAKMDGEEIDTGFHVTAPDPIMLQRLLRKMVQKDLKYAVLEATSHGLDQYRLWGIDFNFGVLTNITHDHLDYHKSLSAYREAKLRLFLNSKTSILNKDDPSFKYLSQNIKQKSKGEVLSYSLKSKADFTFKKYPFKTTLPGIYNKYNSLAATAVGVSLKIKPEIIKEAFLSFGGVKGRLEEIDEGQNFKVYIDFAHTPNALDQVLSFLKKQKQADGRLIAVYGAAGLRDKEKRPMMGEISGRLADLSVITAEDPRTEDVNEICRQIAEGCEKVKGDYKIIPDRQEAFNFVIKKFAKKGDLVVFCGKGHEQSMCFGQMEYPWSEHASARKALRERMGEK